MPIRIVRLGSPRGEGEGARLGTVRRPPRGVRKSDYARLDFYDAWLPELAPSEKLRKSAMKGGGVDPAAWRRFARAYRAEMNAPERRHFIETLARLSRDASFAVGCYCEDFSRCHRSILAELFAAQGADVIVDDEPPRPRRAP
jgi:uncharacterized protein YeaO (DUF488 family)